MSHKETEDQLVSRANGLYAQLKKCETRTGDLKISLGVTLRALKEMKPKDVTWPVYVREKLNYSATQADQYIRIAGGQTTAQEVRSEANARMRKSRAEMASTSRDVGPETVLSGKNTPEAPEKARDMKSMPVKPEVFARMCMYPGLPLTRQVNLIADEVTGFNDEFLVQLKAWMKANQKALSNEDKNMIGGTGKDCLRRTMYELSNEFMRFAHSLDDHEEEPLKMELVK